MCILGSILLVEINRNSTAIEPFLRLISEQPLRLLSEVLMCFIHVNCGKIKMGSALAAEAWAIRIPCSMAASWMKPNSIIHQL